MAVADAEAAPAGHTLQRLWRAMRAPRHATARFILLAFLLWRGGLFTVDLFAVHALPQDRDTSRNFVAYAESPWRGTFVRWDAGWYKSIALGGYQLGGEQANVAFFPAFPYATRWLGTLLGDLWFAGLLLSNLALLGALFYIFGLARRYCDEDGARRAVLFVLIFPTSFFFSAFYTEGLFLLTIAGALYHYERDELWLVGLWGMAAALTRSTGVVLLPALLFGAVHRRGWRWRSLSPRLLWLLLIPAGIAIFAWILHEQVGDGLAFVKAQAGWGRKTAWPLSALIHDASDIDFTFHELTDWQVGMLLDMVATVGLFAAAAYALRRLDAGLTLFLLGSLVMPLLSGRVISMYRFSACMVPLYLVLALCTARPGVMRFTTIAMSLALVVNMAFFTHWWWGN